MDLNELYCPFCKSCEEDVTHLFFSCDKILPLWWEALSWLNIVGVSPEAPRDHFLQQTWWISLTWCRWYHRNRIVFSNEKFKGQRMMDDAIFFCWIWPKNMEKRI